MTDGEKPATGGTDAVDDSGEDATERVVVDSLSRSFGDVTVLDDVSFTADPGTVTCVVGPNGSGKTTLLRIVAGLLPPSEGNVVLTADGERSVGYLPQTPAFRQQFSLAETLAFYGALVEGDVDADAVLERVGLDEVGGRRVEALSGGMTRLFGIALATVGDPPVLVLDEPASGLDPTMTDHVGTAVGDLADAGRTVLLATHELGTVDRVADTVVVLDAGAVAAVGSPAKLRRETGESSLTKAVTALVAGEGALTVRGGPGEGSQ
ncbi:MAG: ABC transporter ATP-binding protein [Haloarculaceae archaeon]